MNNRFLVVIVVYQQHLRDVAPLRYFSQIQNECIKIFIRDNSPESLSESEIPDEYIYSHDPSNGGISRAYNDGARYAKDNGYDWVILFDQDTVIENDYIKLLEKSIVDHPDIKVYAPIVYFNHGIMSPKVCSYFRPSCESLPIGIHPLKKVSIINSGLAVATAQFHKCGGYNDDVFLDFADYQFIERLENEESNFVVFGGELRQDFSNNEIDKQKLYNRFTKYCQCLKSYQTSGFRRIMLYYTAFLHSLSLSRRTKSIRFLIHYIRTIL